MITKGHMPLRLFVTLVVVAVVTVSGALIIGPTSPAAEETSTKKKASKKAATGAQDSPTINGALELHGGQRVLRLWGTHYEMGKAEGYLLGGEIVEIIDEYLLALMPLDTYDMARMGFGAYFTVPQKYVDYAQGILDGLALKGVDTSLPAAGGRAMDLTDLLIANAVPDIGGFAACSSVSAWGAATADDPELQGELAIARNLDYHVPAGNEAMLLDKLLIVSYDHTDGLDDLVSVTLPGLFSILSGFDAEGLGAQLDLGNSAASISTYLPTKSKVPIGFTLRSALEAHDANGDGAATIDDLYGLVESTPRVGSFEIHLFGPAEGVATPAAIAEVNGSGTALRLATDDPALGPTILAVTNHDRKLNPATSCSRYEKIVKALGPKKKGPVSVASLVAMEKKISMYHPGQHLGLWTIYSTVYVPSKKLLGVAFATPKGPASDTDPVYHTWESLFAPPP